MYIQSSAPTTFWAQPMNPTVTHRKSDAVADPTIYEADFQRAGMLNAQQQRANAQSRLQHLKAVDEWYQKMEGLMGRMGQAAEKSMHPETTDQERAVLQGVVEIFQAEFLKLVEQEPVDPTAVAQA